MDRAVISECRHLVLSCEAGSQGDKYWWSEWRVKHLQFRPAHSVINHDRRRQRPRIHIETFDGLRLVVFKNDEIFFRETGDELAPGIANRDRYNNQIDTRTDLTARRCGKRKDDNKYEKPETGVRKADRHRFSFTSAVRRENKIRDASRYRVFTLQMFRDRCR